MVEYQQLARDESYPDKLLKLWEEVCRLYGRGVIGRYELDEMKAIIWPFLRYLCRLKKSVESAFRQEQTVYCRT
ncbi:MAG: hypothetical protein K2Y22_00070 [Candidatus Obscuribacterales bacterium]|nr:hypothetical protein [Candidatus Obscuribacterales bacterium]